MRLWNKTWIFDFFSKFFLTIWKNLSSRSQKSESEISKLNPRFLKNPEGPKMDWKSLNHFCFWPRGEFFKNRGLSFETSESHFRDLLDELFHKVKKNFRNKYQNCRSYFKVPYNKYLKSDLRGPYGSHIQRMNVIKYRYNKIYILIIIYLHMFWVQSLKYFVSLG